MCLKIAHRNLKTVPTHKEGEPSKDKKVYKILLTDGENFYSPLCKFKWALETVVTDPVEPKIVSVKPKHGVSYRLVTKGFFHAFTVLETVVSRARWLAESENSKTFFSKYPKYSIVIHEAIIPEGTKYYEGTDGDICAKSLKILNKDVPIL